MSFALRGSPDSSQFAPHSLLLVCATLPLGAYYSSFPISLSALRRLEHRLVASDPAMLERARALRNRETFKSAVVTHIRGRMNLPVKRAERLAKLVVKQFAALSATQGKVIRRASLPQLQWFINHRVALHTPC